ncbi:hypothetical protein H7992_04730 [Sporosarcina sp. resist]|nr:hypothetical protein H7992_04730 [Sporosarcina sp. resist]
MIYVTYVFEQLPVINLTGSKALDQLLAKDPTNRLPRPKLKQNKAYHGTHDK